MTDITDGPLGPAGVAWITQNVRHRLELDLKVLFVGDEKFQSTLTDCVGFGIPVWPLIFSFSIGFISFSVGSICFSVGFICFSLLGSYVFWH
jgi:hypothetical protein